MIPPLSWDMLTPLLTPRPRECHKADFGHVLIVGGDEGFGGAALMAAEASARCGAGLTSVATHPAHAASFLVRRPELMVRGIAQPETILSLLDRATVVVVGPGLGQSEWSRQCLTTALQAAQQKGLPLVVDADGLNWLSKKEIKEIKYFYEKWILTPHTGEAARLLASATPDIDKNREQSAMRLQQLYGGAVILKGAGSLVCTAGNGRAKVEQCQHGNPGMATGGMGDVLSGICAAMLAQGFDLNTSARLAVCLHSRAADLAASSSGERGLLATDLFPRLQELLNP